MVATECLLQKIDLILSGKLYVYETFLHFPAERLLNESCAADGLCGNLPKDVISTQSVELETTRERACDTLIMCIVTTLNKGLRSGGGIGDVLRKSSYKVC